MAASNLEQLAGEKGAWRSGAPLRMRACRKLLYRPPAAGLPLGGSTGLTRARADYRAAGLRYKGPALVTNRRKPKGDADEKWCVGGASRQSTYTTATRFTELVVPEVSAAITWPEDIAALITETVDRYGRRFDINSGQMNTVSSGSMPDSLMPRIVKERRSAAKGEQRRKPPELPPRPPCRCCSSCV